MKQYPDSLPADYETEVLNLFKRFSSVAVIDDLRTIKRKPNLFRFYTKYSERFEYHTTDNGFLAEFATLMHDVKFGYIGQISFSDSFLRVVNKPILVDMIRKLHLRSPILRVNFVITEQDPTENRDIDEIVTGIMDLGCAVYFHNDIRQDVNFFENLRENGYRQPSCYYIEHSTTPPTKCNVLTETVHLRGTCFYPDLYTSMKENETPFYNFDKFEPEQFMMKLLQQKVDIYRRNAQVMTTESRLKNYFEFVSNQLVIHDDFTFIPAVLLSPRSKFYQSLVDSNQYHTTYAGLLRKGADDLIPMVSWR
jgi:hypothetical protein